MANAFGAFYDLPPWVEEMQRMQRKLEAITKPLLAVQDDTWLAAKNVAAAFESPVMRELELMAKQCTPGLMRAVQQEQELLAKFSPLADIYTEIVGQIPDWTRTVFDTTPFQCDELLLARNHALLQWAEGADRIARTVETVEITPDEIKELPEADQQAIAAEVTAIFADSENWEQRFMARVAEFEKTHPFWAVAIKFLVINVIFAIMVNLASDGIGQTINAAKVYEEPCSTSQVVYHVEQHQTVIVIGEVPYYYEVEVRPENADGVKRGYMSKRSILVKDDDRGITEVAMTE